jgi:hypothetical protein
VISEDRIKSLEERVNFLESKLRERYYRLKYFKGRTEESFIFPFNGGLREAINFGRRHCNVMGYNFGNVRPAIVNLEHREQLKSSHPDWDETQEEPADMIARKEKVDRELARNAGDK